jgi:type II secretory pathway pseudopilin PulG
MKTDKKLLLAIVILIGLVAWLIVISLNKDEKLNNAMNAINQLQQKIDKFQKLQSYVPKDGHTPILGVDYFNGKSVKGDPGSSAYQTAILYGFKGTEQEWLKSLEGKSSAPKQGTSGKSAYDIAVENGFKGTAAEWLESLKVKGDKGDAAAELDIDCIGGLISKKYDGDMFWQKTKIKCEESGNE